MQRAEEIRDRLHKRMFAQKKFGTRDFPGAVCVRRLFFAPSGWPRLPRIILAEGIFPFDDRQGADVHRVDDDVAPLLQEDDQAVDGLFGPLDFHVDRAVIEVFDSAGQAQGRRPLDGVVAEAHALDPAVEDDVFSDDGICVFHAPILAVPWNFSKCKLNLQIFRTKIFTFNLHICYIYKQGLNHFCKRGHLP